MLGEWPGELRRIGQAVLGRANLRLAVIGEPGAIDGVRAPLGGMVAALPEGAGPRFAAAGPAPGAGRLREGWSTATAASVRRSLNVSTARKSPG